MERIFMIIPRWHVINTCLQVLSSLILLLLRPFLCFGQKDMLLDGLTDYIKSVGSVRAAGSNVAAAQEDKDSLAAQVTEESARRQPAPPSFHIFCHRKKKTS